MTESKESNVQAKKTYTTPRVTVMNEEEVLRRFQVTSAMMGWWTPITNSPLA